MNEGWVRWMKGWGVGSRVLKAESKSVWLHHHLWFLTERKNYEEEGENSGVDMLCEKVGATRRVPRHKAS